MSCIGCMLCMSVCLYIDSPSQNYLIIATELGNQRKMIKVNLMHDKLYFSAHYSQRQKDKLFE